LLIYNVIHEEIKEKRKVGTCGVRWKEEGWEEREG